MENERLNYQVFCRKIFPVFHTFVQFCIRFLHDHFIFSRLKSSIPFTHVMSHCIWHKCIYRKMQWYNAIVFWSRIEISIWLRNTSDINKNQYLFTTRFLSTSQPWFVYLYNGWILWCKMSSYYYILLCYVIFHIVVILKQINL